MKRVLNKATAAEIERQWKTIDPGTHATVAAHVDPVRMLRVVLAAAWSVYGRRGGATSKRQPGQRGAGGRFVKVKP